MQGVTAFPGSSYQVPLHRQENWRATVCTEAACVKEGTQSAATLDTASEAGEGAGDEVGKVGDSESESESSNAPSLSIPKVLAVPFRRMVTDTHSVFSFVAEATGLPTDAHVSMALSMPP